MPSTHHSRKQTLIAAILALGTGSGPAYAGDFLHKDSGPYDYADINNWTGGVINNTWNGGNNVSPSITADQTITFSGNYTLSTTWTINNKNAFNHTFISSGGNYTLTLGGNISLGSTGSTTTNIVTVGSVTDGQRLNVDLGGSSREFSVNSNRTLELINLLSGTGSVTQLGTGTLRLLNTANTYTGSTNFGKSGVVGGVIEITKLADGGQASSIGTSSNAATNLIFGGATTAGTLRYIGTGDSTDRRFSVGGVGAQFDASGTGAINWTNTSNVSWSGSGNTARSVTLRGTSTHANTMSAAFGDNGTGKTSITKQGSGRWILSGNNTFTGTITIDAGILELGSAASGGNGAELVMNGGTFATGGFSETFTTLTLSANSTIDFGSGDSDLVFADSSGTAWGGSISLTIINFTEGVDSIKFGINRDGLTLDQLGQITINGQAASIDDSGFLSAVAIPEPSSYALLAGVGTLALAGLRRRSR